MVHSNSKGTDSRKFGSDVRTDDAPILESELGTVLEPKVAPKLIYPDVSGMDWGERVTTRPRVVHAEDNPAMFSPNRLVHPRVARYDDMPSLSIPRNKVNLGKHRNRITEYEHSVFGNYFRAPRKELKWPVLPAFDNEEYLYQGPQLPSLTEAKTRASVTCMIVAAYQAAVHMMTGKPCDLYSNSMTVGENACIQAAAKELLKANVKPHQWAIFWLHTMCKFKKRAWNPKRGKPPKISRVFNKAIIIKQGEEAKIVFASPTVYQHEAAGRARLLLEDTQFTIRELRHYDNVRQEDIDSLASRRVIQYQKDMDLAKAAYRSKYAKDQYDVDNGKWIWARLDVDWTSK